MSHNDFFFFLDQISEKASSFLKRQLTPYIHCSKLNSVLGVIQQIPSLLNKEQDNQPQHNFTNIQNNAFSSIISILNSFEDLIRSCSKENCVHFLLNTPLSIPLSEVCSLRSAAIVPFKQLNQPVISNLFIISDEKLNQQDEVDMKRIAQILIQVSNSKRDDISKQIQQRFDSLKRKGIDYSPDVSCDVTVPDLPKNMNFVIKHSDVELIKQIGKGQSGTVSLGKYKGNEVAVKILYRRALSQPELESFRREIVVLSLLDYPTLLKFYGYSEEPPFYILTDYMPNGSLFDFLRKSPEKLTPTHRTLIALDVARGLEYLHSRNIIHRDMKSLNVLLDSNLRAKICDFGMVRMKQNAPMTGLIGTPHWMAPEVFMSLPTYNEKVDVFSYGILLWELLTNDMPYNGMKQTDITIGVTSGTLRPPLPPGPPTKLTQLIERCWSQDPNERPTMSQIVSQIEKNPKYHFTGTNENEFRNLFDKTKHRSTASQIVTHRKKKSKRKSSGNSKILPDLDDDADNNTGDITEGDVSIFMVADVISQIEDSKNADDRKEALKKLCGIVGSTKKSSNEIARDSKGCQYICECLSNKDLSEICMNNLKNCQSELIFSVDVLKTLLQFANNEDQKLRELALQVLIEASKLRFNFLVSAPSFLLQLLNFLNKPIESSLSVSLLQLSNKLLDAFVTVPEGFLPIFFKLKNSGDKDVEKESLKCISASLKFNTVRNEMTEEMWNDFLTSDSFKESMCDSFVEGTQRSSSDSIFLKRLCVALPSKSIEACLPNILKNSRFSSIFVEILPIKESKKKDSNSEDSNSNKVNHKHISVVYKTVMKKCPFLMSTIASEVYEFYQMAAYFLTHNKIEFICNEMKHYFRSNYINMKLLLKSKFCDSLFNTFLEATKPEHILPLTSVIYEILIQISSPFTNSVNSNLITYIAANSKLENNLFLFINSSLILQKLFVLMMCDQDVYRMPSFLCISSIAFARRVYFSNSVIASRFNSHVVDDSIDFEKLLTAAAFYVNCDILVTRKVANKIIQFFINKQKDNLMLITKVFVGNFKTADENTKSSANAIIDISHDEQLLDDVLQMVMAISEK